MVRILIGCNTCVGSNTILLELLCSLSRVSRDACSIWETPISNSRNLLEDTNIKESENITLEPRVQLIHIQHIFEVNVVPTFAL